MILISVPGHNLQDHLLATQEWVANELARSKRNWLLAVGHFDDLDPKTVYVGETDVELSLGSLALDRGSSRKFVVARVGYSKW